MYPTCPEYGGVCLDISYSAYDIKSERGFILYSSRGQQIATTIIDC